MTPVAVPMPAPKMPPSMVPLMMAPSLPTANKGGISRHSPPPLGPQIVPMKPKVNAPLTTLMKPTIKYSIRSWKMELKLRPSRKAPMMPKPMAPKVAPTRMLRALGLTMMAATMPPQMAPKIGPRIP